MATEMSLHVIKLPNDGQPTGVTSAGVIYGVPTGLTMYVTAATAAQTTAYPGTVSVITSQYWRNAQRLTGTWYVVETVSAILTAAGASLQSVHALMLPNGSNAPGFGAAGTVYLINNSLIDTVAPVATALLTTYPNAAASISTRTFNNNQQFTGTYLVTESIATVIGAS